MMTSANKTKSPFSLETACEAKVPYARFMDAETIETKNGNLLQVIKVEGLLADTLDDVLVDMEKHIRNTLLISLTDSTTSFYFHTIRRKEKVGIQGKYQDGFLQKLHDKWQTKLKHQDFYINEHFITIVKKPPVGKINRLSDVFTSLLSSFDHKERERYRQKTLKDLNKVANQVITGLAHYGATKLSNKTCDEKKGLASDCLSFLSYLLNLELRTMMAPEADLSSVLSYKRLFFDKSSGTIALRSVNNQVRYAAILSFKNYCANTYAGILDRVFDIDAEIVVTQSFSPLEKDLIRNKIKENQRNQSQSDDGETSATQKINHVLDDMGSGEATQGEHHVTLLCHADTLASLESKLSKIDATLNQIGIVAIREDAGIQAAFFAMLPGNHAYITRKGLVSSKNMAGLASMHNSSIGRAKNNHWGDAITVLETISGSPYYFNFHVMDVGNTYMIGPMGSGKTLLESFLLAQSMRFGGKLVAFDKDRGMEIFIRALGGSYAQLQMGKPTGFAPFQLSDTPDNRFLLFSLMRKIVTMQGIAPSAEVDEVLNFAIKGAFNLPKPERILRNIVPFMGMKKAGSIRAVFENWVNDGSYAWVFDHDEDAWSLSQPIMGFDMTSLLGDSLVSSVIYKYLFNRVESMIDGSKMRIVVAEGWRALQDETFCEKIKDWSSTPRKKNAFLVMDTQSPDDIAKSDIACKIIQETVTQIYFANPTANYDDYVGQFKLTEKEYQIIKSLNKDAHFFLLKQGKHSVVVRADLKDGFQDEIAILSGRTGSVKLLDNIRQEKGDEPNQWMPSFIERVKAIGKDA